jgi:hypothetical protein
MLPEKALEPDEVLRHTANRSIDDKGETIFQRHGRPS